VNPTFDVAIVGFGPAGAVCANLLGRAGVRVLVVDKSRTVYDKPRAFALDHEIMRVFQNLGLADAITPHTALFTPSEYYGVDGQLIKRLGSVPPPYPLGWPPNMVFTQPPVEAILREGTARYANVTIDLGCELVALAQDGEGVSFELRDDTGGARRERARYLIGCDGASSTVRALVGIEVEDLEFDEPWLVVDLQVNERGRAKLPQVSVQYCDPSRPATYLIGPGAHRRWEIMVMPGEDRHALEDETQVWRLLARWITPDDATLWRRASYRFHALVAREWRRDRVFIAGDAAHQQPPFTGQGMCQGVRDVANLAWKLVRVLAGRSSDALLDTYAIERRAHVKRLTAIVKDIGRLVCERDPAAARARDARLLAEAGGVVKTVPRQALIPPIEGGLLSPIAHPANGTIFPQPDVRHAGRALPLDEVTGTSFRVVVMDSIEAPPLPAALDACIVAVDELSDSEGLLWWWFVERGCAAAIVRPDHYVYGVATSAAELDAQLRSLTRALAGPA
jgi:3-(3-hydroxy-phenyl)propionate hydroxylase